MVRLRCARGSLQYRRQRDIGTPVGYVDVTAQRLRVLDAWRAFCARFSNSTTSPIQAAAPPELPMSCAICDRLRHSGTHHAAVELMDERARGDAEARLKRIAGQVAGLQRMLSDDRYCVDVLLQVAAVRAALGEVGKVVLTNHVQTCLSDAMEGGGSKDQRAKLDELMDVFSRYSALGQGGRTPKPRLQRRK